VLHQSCEVKIARCELARGAHDGDEGTLDIRIVEAHGPQKGPMRCARDAAFDDVGPV
jgi:hypothetical protein